MIRVPRSLQDIRRRLDAEAADLAAILKRLPPPLELAQRAQVSVEDVLEALIVSNAHRPDSLDRPLNQGDDHATANRAPGEVDPGYAEVESAIWLRSLFQNAND